MTTNPAHRMLVVHNIASTGERVLAIEAKPFRKFGFGSLLAYADEVAKRLGEERLLLSDSLALPAGVASYGREELQGIAVGEKYDSVVCHLVLDHGGVLAEDFFSTLRAEFLKADGALLNPVQSITKNDVARASHFELETQTAPCVIKKNNNYNRPETVFEIHNEAELAAWRAARTTEEQSRYVMHKLLRYFGSEQSRMYQLERWLVLFDDLTVNYRYSNEFYIKRATSLSYYARDERRLSQDLARLADSGYDWKGRSIDCAYDHDPAAWDARYAVLETFRNAFRFDYAELDVIQPTQGEFVVIDVNHTPGPAHANIHARELAARALADTLGIRLGHRGRPEAATEPKTRTPPTGSAEETYVEQLAVARRALEFEEPEDVVLHEYLEAFNLRPTRVEPLHDLARYFRRKKQYGKAYVFARTGVEIEQPSDSLSVSQDVYDWRMLDELSVAAYWVGDYASAKEACETVLARVQGSLSVPAEDLSRIEENLAHALKKLGV
jgi:hypothetical protein